MIFGFLGSNELPVIERCPKGEVRLYFNLYQESVYIYLFITRREKKSALPRARDMGRHVNRLRYNQSGFLSYMTHMHVNSLSKCVPVKKFLP